MLGFLQRWAARRAATSAAVAHLGVNALAVRGYPGVAVFHALLMAVTYAKGKAVLDQGRKFLS
jgi:hypothetical protein